MKKQIRKKMICIALSGCLAGTVLSGGGITAKGQGFNSFVVQKVFAVKKPSMSYQAHIENDGWQVTVGENEVAGSTGRGLRMECLIVNLKDSNGNNGIKYRTHISHKGWESGWRSSGQRSGTEGESKAIECVQMKLDGNLANNYQIYYRVHVSKLGWLAWAHDGENAGSVGFDTPVEAIQIKLLPKGQTEKGGVSALGFSVQGHSANIGWQTAVGLGDTVGTTSQSCALEALVLNCLNPDGSSAVSINSHVQDIGWTGWKGSGQISGTTGKSLQMEAVQIKLTGTLAYYYDIYYRAHVGELGWLGWAVNGGSSGSTGSGLRMEALEVQIVPKGQEFATGGTAYVENYNTQANAGTAAQSAAALISQRLQAMMDGTAYNGSYKVNTRYKGEYSGEQCKGFAKSIHKKLFGYNIGSTKAKPNNYKINISSSKSKTVGSTKSMSKSNMKTIFNNARPGDFIQVRRSHGGSHSMIYLSSDQNSVTVFECNTDGRNGIRKNTYSYSTFCNKNAGVSVYTAKDYYLH